MDFSDEQSKAIDAVGEWLKAPSKQTFYLAGFAGTGKTTLAKYLAEQQDGEVLFAAYTGKAASVLNRKGCPASTIHSLIYKVIPPDQGRIADLRKKLKDAPAPEKSKLKQELFELSKPRFRLNEESLINDCALVVIDEVSMVGPEVGADLIQFDKKILVLGDPGQLPPVQGGGYFTSHEPDFLLTEVHRQARDSPIINMATVVRQGGRLSKGSYGASLVADRRKMERSAYLEPDQVIVGLNRTRHSINSSVRDARDCVGAMPKIGEKIICLRNNHEQGLLNGTQWIVDKVEDKGNYLELDIVSLDYNGNEPLTVAAHHFDVDLANMPYWDRKRAEEFAFGYAITCHKSQGSQWPFVLVQDESYAFREDAKRWLYTALTRAETKVTVAI